MSITEIYLQSNTILKRLIPVLVYHFIGRSYTLKKTLNEVSFTVAKNSDVKNVHMVERYVLSKTCLIATFQSAMNEMQMNGKQCILLSK